MDRSLENLLLNSHFGQERMAFIVGPRQVGKTTLARMLQARRNSEDLYRNWDDLGWRREFSRDPYGFIDAFRPIQADQNDKPLVVLDEIHRHPQWKRYIKGLWDTRKDRIDVVVTGSERLDIYQRSGDSLLGRYHQYRLHPLSVREVVDPGSPGMGYELKNTLDAWLNVTGKPTTDVKEAFEGLLRWGGFPEPFLRQNTRRHRQWQKERKNLIVREDLRDLTRIQLLSHVEQLVELLSERSARILSMNSIREDLQVALDSVRLWIDSLKRLYFLYLIKPYAGTMARALRREPKAYLWDWSDIDDQGRRFENLMASHLLKWCNFADDLGYPELSLHFVRDKQKREVDFLITKEKEPWLLIEAKLSRKEPEKALSYFAEKLGVKEKFLVVAKLDAPGVSGDIHVIDAPSFLSCLPV